MSPFIRPASIRHADRLLATSIFCFLLALYSASMSTQPDVLDGEVEFQSTSALMRTGSLALGGTPEGDAIARAGFNCHPGAGEQSDKMFSWFGVGQAYVAAPFYLAGAALARVFPNIEAANSLGTHMGVPRSEYFAHLFVGWRNPLLGALTAAMIAISARRLGSTRKSAWLAGMSYGLCTFAWPQARSTFNSVQATFFLFLAVHSLLAISEAYHRFRRPERSTLLLAGLGMGMAFLTRMVMAPALVVIGIALLWVLLRAKQHKIPQASWSDLIWILAPALACLGIFLATNNARFGSPWETGYGDTVTWDNFFGFPPQRGLAGLLISPSRGLFYLAPGAVLGLITLWLNLRRGDLRLPLLIAGLSAAILLPPALTVGWHGAVGYGPRYALPLLPLLWLGVGPGLDLLQRRKTWRWFSAALLLFGLSTSLPGVLVDTSTHFDLAHQAALLRYPEMPGVTEEDRAAARFERIQWDLDFAAPWSHWRILRHRVAELPEEFPAGEIFNLEGPHKDALLKPAHERERGFRHLAWVDFRERLGGHLWAPLLLGVALIIAGLVNLSRGFDADRA